MSTNRGSIKSARIVNLSYHFKSVMFAVIGSICPPVSATVDGESALLNSPPPHEKIGPSRETVKVHWVRLQGHFEGTRGNTAMLDELKSAVQSCVQSAQLGARQTRPPHEWPDYVMGTQDDEYNSSNRSINYRTTLLYTVNPADCSLTENRRMTAVLASTEGRCEIDLDKKKAHGFCDSRAHAYAPPVAPLRLPASLAGAHRPVPPALAALDQAKKLGPAPTGERKTIAGLECDVWTNPLDPGGTMCLSRGGSFVGWHAFGPTSNGSGMVLEMTSQVGMTARAVKAQLDGTVNEAVFTPYLGDGFEVASLKRRK